jgi:hypothetical protein
MLTMLRSDESNWRKMEDKTVAMKKNDEKKNKATATLSQKTAEKSKL